MEEGVARTGKNAQGVRGPFEKLRSSLWSEVNVSTGSTVREKERGARGEGERGLVGSVITRISKCV